MNHIDLVIQMLEDKLEYAFKDMGELPNCKFGICVKNYLIAAGITEPYAGILAFSIPVDMNEGGITDSQIVTLAQLSAACIVKMEEFFTSQKVESKESNLLRAYCERFVLKF